MTDALAIERVDFIGIPSRDLERSRRFYGETLGLPRDRHAENEFWAGESCLSLWIPEAAGREHKPSSGFIALRVPDVEAARAALEQKGVEFQGGILDTSVCHMAFFSDPDGNELMLHRRYAP